MYIIGEYNENFKKKKDVVIKKVRYNGKVYNVHQEGSTWYTINTGVGFLEVILKTDAKVIKRGKPEVGFEK